MSEDEEAGPSPRESEVSRQVSREEWMAYLLDLAPEITVEQWDETVAALLALRPLRGTGSQKPSPTKLGAPSADKVRASSSSDRHSPA